MLYVNCTALAFRAYTSSIVTENRVTISTSVEAFFVIVRQVIADIDVHSLGKILSLPILSVTHKLFDGSNGINKSEL